MTLYSYLLELKDQEHYRQCQSSKKPVVTQITVDVFAASEPEARTAVFALSSFDAFSITDVAEYPED